MDDVAGQALITFLANGRLEDVPGDVVRQGKRCLLDLLGVAAGGYATEQATIVRDYVAEEMEVNDGARLLYDGRVVQRAGAAWANATAIESLDGHDGHALTKGHAGVALLPSLLSLTDRSVPCSGESFLLRLIQGYEIAVRAGIALHASSSEYHSSGAWNAVACAVCGAHLLGADGATILEAAGIGEYFGPRGPMMRCIAVPTMVKDSSGWGSYVGTTAALLAVRGFTGGPAEVVSGLTRGEGATSPVESLWLDLGSRWRIGELYFKAHPVCRWAQPAVAAALQLVRSADVQAGQVARIEVGSFREAVLLATRAPVDTEQAQYSLPFSVGTAVARGRLTADEVSVDALSDPEILRLAQAVDMREVSGYSRRFPAERLADVTLVLHDGRRLVVAEVPARGDPDRPLGDEDLIGKFHDLARPLLGGRRTERIQALVGGLDTLATMEELLDEIMAPSTGE